MKKGEVEFIRWMPSILNALRQMGGSGTARDVIKSVANWKMYQPKRRK